MRNLAWEHAHGVFFDVVPQPDTPLSSQAIYSFTIAFLSGCGCFLWDVPDDVTFTSNSVRETACHKEERSFGVTVKVCTNQFINTVIASHFWLILVLCEIAACHKEERPFKMRKKSTQTSLLSVQ